MQDEGVSAGPADPGTDAGEDGSWAGARRGRQQRSVATREALIAAARSLFAQAGYHATGTPELVARASVTRGALYHHFADKAQLFEAVFREVEGEITQAAKQAVAPLSGDTWSQLVLAFQTYLAVIAARPDAQRILLIDGPAVLGWPRWRALQSEYLFKGLVVTLDMLVAASVIPDQPKEPLAQLIVAAVNEAALSIAHAEAPDAVQRELTGALTTLLQGLRVGRSGRP